MARFDAPTVLGLVLRAEETSTAPVHVRGRLRISRRNGLNVGMAGAIAGLACLAGDAGDWDRAAALHGVAQAFQDRTGNPWQEPDARYRRDSLTKRGRTWATSSWSAPTPRAWRSASRRPSTWPSRKRARPGRYRRKNCASPLTGQARTAAIPRSRSRPDGPSMQIVVRRRRHHRLQPAYRAT